jgi:hypothetical protein
MPSGHDPIVETGPVNPPESGRTGAAWNTAGLIDRIVADTLS